MKGMDKNEASWKCAKRQIYDFEEFFRSLEINS